MNGQRLLRYCLLASLLPAFSCAEASQGADGSTTIPPGDQADAAAWPSADEVGACPPEWQASLESGSLDLDRLVDFVSDYPMWTFVNAISELEKGDSLVAARLDQASQLVGDAPSDVLIQHASAVAAAAELDRGARVLVGVNPAGSLGATAGPVVSLRPDGHTVFLGPCAKVLSAEFSAYVHDINELRGSETPSTDVFEDLIQQRKTFESLRSWTEGMPPVPWKEQSPDLRLLDVDETPRSVLDSLIQVSVKVNVPAEWRTFDAVICTRASLGWNECSALDLDIDLFAYAVPDEDLELWLLNGSAELATPLMHLGPIAAGEIRNATTADRPTVLVAIQSEETTLADVVDPGADPELSIEVK